MNIPRSLRRRRRRRVPDHLTDLVEITHELVGIRRGVGQLLFLAAARLPGHMSAALG